MKVCIIIEAFEQEVYLQLYLQNYEAQYANLAFWDTCFFGNGGQMNIPYPITSFKFIKKLFLV